MNTGYWRFLAGIILAGNALLSVAVEPERAKDQPKDDSSATFTVTYSGNDIYPSGHVKAKHGTYQYKAYIPPGYSKNPNRKYPCLFVMSPSGNANIGPLAARMRNDEWIVIMLVDARNGPWEPILGNFCAAHDDAVKRFRIAEGLKYATGYSGGARGSSVFVNLRPGFAGLFLQGAGLGPANKANDHIKLPKDLAVYAAFGNKDFNLYELDYLKGCSSRYKQEIFPGGHDPAPADVCERAFDWFNEQLLSSRPGSIPRSSVINLFEKRYARIADEPTPLGRYDLCVELVKLAQAHSLSADPALAPRVQKLQQLAQQIPTTPSFQRELSARNAYRQTEANLNRSSPPYDSGTVQRAIIGFKAVANTYQDTEYGKKAAERASELDSGSKPR